jgi:hypothetical protein
MDITSEMGPGTSPLHQQYLLARIANRDPHLMSNLWPPTTFFEGKPQSPPHHDSERATRQVPGGEQVSQKLM